MFVSKLRFPINLLGSLAFAAYLVNAVLSYVQAPALWGAHAIAPRANAFFESLAIHFPLLEFNRLLGGIDGVVISYSITLAVAAAAAMLAALLLARRHLELDAAIVAALLRWAIAFAVASVLAFPLFTQDFWLSFAWGRMVAAWQNPFHTLFTPDSLGDLPLDHFPMLMSYGPGWAILSGIIMAVSGKSVLAGSVLFKLVLMAAWVGALLLVERINSTRSFLHRSLAIVVFGWMPLGLVQSLSEGHNDIVMTALALLWMSLLLRGRGGSTYALVAATLAKYVTGPLFLVDAIAAKRLLRVSWPGLLLRYLGPAVLGLAVMAVFFRSLQFFEGTRVISEWRFLQPRDVLGALEDVVGFSMAPLQYVIAAGFALVAVRQVIDLWRQPGPDTVIKAALAIMSAISFTVIAHLWPWYLVWTLALAALLPGWWLSRFVIGVAVLAPFTLPFWWVEALLDLKDWAALVMYSTAILLIVATRTTAQACASGSGAHAVDAAVERPAAAGATSAGSRLASSPVTLWLAAAILGGAVQFLLWQVSEPPNLFCDFMKANYAAANNLWHNGLSATWPLTEKGGFSNIPILAWIYAPLGAMRDDAAGWTFWAIGIAALFASWALLVRLARLDAMLAAGLLLLILVSGPVVNSLREGQTTHFILLLLTLAVILWQRGSDYAAGLLLGFCALIKLPLLLLGVYFGVRLRWRIVAGGATMVAVVAALSLAQFGMDGNIGWYKEWVEPYLNGFLPAFNVQSIDGFLTRLAAGAPALRLWEPPIEPGVAHRIARYGIFAVLFGATFWPILRSVRRRSVWSDDRAPGPRELLEFVLVINLALVTSPISWTHYYLLLLLPWALYLGGQLSLPHDAATRWLMRTACLLVSLPAIMYGAEEPDWLNAILARTVVSVWLFGGLLMFVALARGLWRDDAAAAAASPRMAPS